MLQLCEYVRFVLVYQLPCFFSKSSYIKAGAEFKILYIRQKKWIYPYKEKTSTQSKQRQEKVVLDMSL